MNYDDFVRSKRRSEVATGHQPGELNEHLFDFQHAIVSWAVRRGRAAIFADTGLGKTLMQLSWAQEVASHTGHPVLVLAPLAVSEQTIEQGSMFGIDVQKHTGDMEGPNVYITNYERMDSVQFDQLAGIVLDESSILKAHDGKTRQRIIDAAQSVPYRLSCTATPSPNDFEELGNQCEFLGVMSRTEMLATYFVNDTGDTGTWRLKGWGASKFWEWMGTWAVVIRNPSDIGFDGEKYRLPPLEYFEHVVEHEMEGEDLFGKPSMTLQERRKAQRDSIEARCKALATVVNADTNEPWLIWCHLNDEAELLAELIPGSVNVQGSDSPDFKASSAMWFCGKNGDTLSQCFRDKLAKINGEGQCQKRHINKNTTSKTEKEDLLNQSNISKETRKSDQSTCESTQSKILKNLSARLNSNQPLMNVGEQNIQKIKSIGSKSSSQLKNGKHLIQTNDLISVCESMELQEMTTGLCLNRNQDDALYANQQITETQEQTDFMLTTVMQAEKSEDCFVCHATTGSENSKTQSNRLETQLSTLSQPRQGRVLISKPRMFGYGLNFQHCARMAFVGLDDSFEKFYQSVRRCYRFGQKRNVHVHIFTAASEGQILANIKRKEEQHHQMSENMIEHMRDIMNNELKGQTNITEEYREDTYKGDGYTIHLGDCVKWSRRMDDNSIDYSVFSPPFADLFVYSNSDHDMGNCKDDEEFAAQLQFLITELFRIIKPGRNVSFHCMNLPTTKMRQGFIGLRDFRGTLIRAFQDAGFIYHSEVCIWKDPVVAMQRTKALGLLHKTIRENSTMSRMGLPDYVVTMRKPGDCEERVTHGDDLPVMMWQKYASPIWDDIDQGRTLNRMPARDENDEKHMCPLQLDVIERCIHLWTNHGDLVFSPFTGIGSEGYCAVKMGRRFVGTELKPQYFDLACQNIADAKSAQADLFSNVG